MKIMKFGGTSLSHTQNIKLALNIINSHSGALGIVVSAPGKRHKNDIKITDLFYTLYNQYKEYKLGKTFTADYKCTLQSIKKRFKEIVSGLDIVFDLNYEFDLILSDLKAGESMSYIASRGEYLMAKILSKKLNYPCIEAGKVIRFTNKKFDLNKSISLIKNATKNLDKFVMGGFYGATARGEIITFTRGGSDFTGSVVARAVGAAVYENWTDADGLFCANPTIINAPHKIKSLTYDDMQKLSFYGASVLHKDSVYPLYNTNIKINIKNTFNQKNIGTFVSASGEDGVLGITGIKGYFKIELSNDDVDKIKDISHLEFLSRGAKTTTLLSLKPLTVKDVNLSITPSISRVAIVGELNLNTIISIFTAINKTGCDLEFVEISDPSVTLIGVADSEYERVVSAIYNELFTEHSVGSTKKENASCAE